MAQARLEATSRSAGLLGVVAWAIQRLEAYLGGRGFEVGIAATMLADARKRGMQARE